MYHKIFLIGLLIISQIRPSCAQTTESINTNISVNIDELFDTFNKSALLERVKFLSLDSLEGRRTGEKGGLIARDYVISQFKKYNVSPLLNSYTQPFSFESGRSKKTYEAANVLGVIRGSEHPEKYIVISAHYDHVRINKGQIYNGADDDASGTSALFAMAEYFNQHPPKHSIILAAFDAEELGLKGAYHFVEEAKSIGLNVMINVNMDMIGRNDNNELYVVGLSQNPNLKPILENTPLPDNFKLLSGHDGLDGKQNWMNSSDHAAFNKAGIPFLYFGVEDHEDYHKPTDDYEKIQPEFYIKAVTTILSVSVALDKLTF